MNSNDKIEEIGRILIDKSRPLKERFRALFTLRNIGGDTAVASISACFEDDSALLKHECAYCLGQMRNTSAIPPLTKVLSNRCEDPMVRHEAGNLNSNYQHYCLARYFHDYQE